MSKKMKLRLPSLNVRSFITSIENPQDVKAGGIVSTETCVGGPSCPGPCITQTCYTWCDEVEPRCKKVFSQDYIETCPESCLCSQINCLSENVPC